MPCSPGVPRPGRGAAPRGVPRPGGRARAAGGQLCRCQGVMPGGRDASRATSAAPRCRAAAGGGVARRATYASDRLLRQSVAPSLPPAITAPPHSPLAQRKPLSQRHARVELRSAARCGLPRVRTRVGGRDVCRLVGAGRAGEHTHTHVHTRAHIAPRCVRARCLLVAWLLGAEQVGAAEAEAHAQRREVTAQRGERPAPAPLVHLHRSRASSLGSYTHCRCTHARRTRCSCT